MTQFNLPQLVINSDSYKEALKSGRNLWIDAEENITVLLLSPEEMQNTGFRRLLDTPQFSCRISVLAIDEVHLVHWWGKSFRRAFLMLGVVRDLLPTRKGVRTPVLGVSATLRKGPVLDAVCSRLGLIPGEFHFMRRSNMRHDIQIICRELRSGMSGINFSDLDWILDEGENTVIFCKTILVGFRVAAYLWRKAQGIPNREKRVRLFNALNWPEYNAETLGFLNNNSDVSVTIATDTLSVGWDSRYTRNAVLIGEPDDIDEFVQKIGRVGRDAKAVPFPRAFLYYSQGALETSRRVVASGPVQIPEISVDFSNPMSKNPTKQKKGDDKFMDFHVAHFLLATCKPRALHEIYDNPELDTPCTCQTCQINPPSAQRSECNCSGCKPETLNPLPPRNRAPARYPRARPGEGLSTKMRTHGIARLRFLRQVLFNQGSDQDDYFLPPESFLPEEVIKDMLDRFHLIKETQDLHSIVGHIHLLNGHHQQILQFCGDLRTEFMRIRVEDKEAQSRKKANQENELQGATQEEDTTNTIDEVIIHDVENLREAEVYASQGKFRWKINFACGHYFSPC